MPPFCNPTTKIIALLAVSMCTGTATAQRADVPIEPERVTAARPDALEKLAVLRETGKLQSIKQIQNALRRPKPQAIVLPASRTTPLDPPAIAATARRSTLRVGWYYLCNKCDHWHLNSAGGYVVAEGGVAVTCYHVVEPNTAEMREGYLVAGDTNGDFYAVESILAADERTDSAVIRLAGAKALPPLPLNDQVGPGDAAYLLSDPKGFFGYFSAGIVNRFYWQGNRTGDARSFDGARGLRVNVSTDWAPGSSGSPVLDGSGNVIGHVSRIRTEVAPANAPAPRPGTPPDQQAPTSRPTTSRPAPNPPTGTQIVLHEGIPARVVQLQIAKMKRTAPPTTKPE